MTARAWRRALGLGALFFVAPVHGAVSLGELEVRSLPGAPLEARIAVRGNREALRASCFSLTTRANARLPGPTLELRRSSHGASLFVRTRGPVDAGASFAIAIASACRDAAGTPAAEYSVRFAAPAAASLPAVTSTESNRSPRGGNTAATARLPVVASLAAREGDTLGSLAEVIFPRDPIARARYLQEIRAENPALAAYGDEEPIAPGTTVALPDLYAFAATVPAEPVGAASAPASPRTTRPPVKASASKRATRIAAAPAPGAAPTASPPPRREERRAPADAGFRLRLSSPVMDLAPTRGMDERKRAELRERLAVLEADDRTAAMLAMREDIRRLESQVNELRLKLAALPLAKAQPRIDPPRIQAPQAAATKTEPQKIQAPQSASTKTEPPKIQAPQSAATKTEPPETQSPKREAPTPAPAQTPEEPRRPAVIPRVPGEEPWYSDVLWWLRLLLVPLAGVLGLRYFARRRPIIPDYAEEAIAPDLAVTEPGADAADTKPPPEDDLLPQPAPDAATRVPAEDNLELRRRYIEERFPEIASGAVRLDDPRSMVKAARLLYDDGAFARAIELLQFAIEQEPAEMRAWLALFAIFRLQGLPGEFAELARRFAERHGTSDEWRDVRAIGRSLDPADPLYEGEEVVAALDGGPEGWLRAPADSRGLAGELRSRLMAEASVTDADLAPDPIPALRKAEVFSVA